MAKINQKEYNFYVVLRINGKFVIESGWEYKQDAAEHVKENMPISYNQYNPVIWSKKYVLKQNINLNLNGSWIRNKKGINN